MAQRTPSAKTPERHVVFDIDWTIVSEIKKPTPEILKNKRLIKVQDKTYYVNEGLEEFIAEILSHPEMKISFYSGGESIRNQELLSKIKLKDGRSLLQIAYKIMSKEDLVIMDAPVGARFSERYKKDLTKISKDMDQLIMFDDTPNFIKNSEQAEHVFFIGKALEHYETFLETEGTSGEYVPKNYDEWFLNNKKLVVLNGVFREAYTESVEDGIPFSETMKKREGFLNMADHEWNNQTSIYFKKIQKIDFSRPHPKGVSCQQMARSLIGF
ncbi:MAG: hypothetical protein H7177_13545 [Rhizobacter sp.]|nr:hypothetical protein [Bacteriovorax sp.]